MHVCGRACLEPSGKTMSFQRSGLGTKLFDDTLKAYFFGCYSGFEIRLGGEIDLTSDSPGFEILELNFTLGGKLIGLRTPCSWIQT